MEDKLRERRPNREGSAFFIGNMSTSIILSRVH
jgi:hypothetical protein